MADVLAAVYAFGAIQTALIGKLRHGRGQFIDVALMDSMINMLVFECQEAQFPSGSRRPLYVPMRARDGFVIVAPVNQRNFEQLADATGNAGWRTDPRFATDKARQANWEALMAAIEGWTSSRRARECEDVLMKAGVLLALPDRGRSRGDPQIVARRTLASVLDARRLIPGAQPALSILPTALSQHGLMVPLLGEHARYSRDRSENGIRRGRRVDRTICCRWRVTLVERNDGSPQSTSILTTSSLSASPRPAALAQDPDKGRSASSCSYSAGATTDAMARTLQEPPRSKIDAPAPG